MFRFWSPESRGSDKTAEVRQTPSELIIPVSAVAPIVSALKRGRSRVETDPHQALADDYPSAKRTRTDRYGGLPSPTSVSVEGEGDVMDVESPKSAGLEGARDVIEAQFGLEILLKHNELRLIDQELAKCQIALEQLRRCHLLPYPVNCPTPEQMVKISSGLGPALQSQADVPVPRWAPPFGVVEGPYARHYAKWLIPDPIFDGLQPGAGGLAEGTRSRTGVVEGRATRNTGANVGPAKRGARSTPGQRLQALSSGYSQPKDKRAPCILKRSDGAMVKLVCNDCNRWDFSSTQGFINHCRIAHKREFKSHDEAAVHCGQLIEVDAAGGIVGETRPAATPSANSVHPLARNGPIMDTETYSNLRNRVKSALAAYERGEASQPKRSTLRVTGDAPNPSGRACHNIGRAKAQANNAQTASRSAHGLVGSASIPHLSRFLKKMYFNGDVDAYVEEAMTKIDWDDLVSPTEDVADQESAGNAAGASNSLVRASSLGATRTPAVMRVLMRTTAKPAASPEPDPLPSKPVFAQLDSSGIAKRGPDGLLQREIAETPMYDDEVEDVELSPNTVANAPSLVSDDGEYDDSDDGSSETSESIGLENEYMTDVAEIKIEENDDQHTPQPPLRATSKYKKQSAKPISLVTQFDAENGRKQTRE